ncbi:MAG: L-threonylcarbamoyladenylate synthase [Candidatus Methanospirareceae archaeon]
MQPELETLMQTAIATIKRGGTVIYPTETVYGLGADALSEAAIAKVYELKRRERSKPLPLAVSSLKMLQCVAVLEEPVLLDLLAELLPGPVTFLLPKKELVPDLLTAGSDLVGVRFPDNEIALRIIGETGPITATSANISGRKPPTRAEEVVLDADVLINGGTCKYSMPSTVVAVTSVTATGEAAAQTSRPEIKILRKGAWYERVLHVLRRKATGEGIYRLSLSELRGE